MPETPPTIVKAKLSEANHQYLLWVKKSNKYQTLDEALNHVFDELRCTVLEPDKTEGSAFIYSLAQLYCSGS